MALKSGPRVGGPKDFWHIIKSVSIAEIAREANRPLSVALVGPQAQREEALRALFTEDAQEAAAEQVRIRALPESPFVQGFDGLTEGDGFPQVSGIFDLVIDLGADRTETPTGLLIYSLHEIGGWDATLERVLGRPHRFIAGAGPQLSRLPPPRCQPDYHANRHRERPVRPAYGSHRRVSVCSAHCFRSMRFPTS